MNNKLIAIIAVAVVVIAGAAAIVVMNGDNSKDSVKIDTALAVYGNANNDTTVDNKDVEIIEKIIKGDLKATDYPLADADGNGTVDSKDVEFTKSIIDKTATKVNIVCLDKNSKTTIVSVKYPLTNVVAVGTNMMPVVINCGASSALCARFGTNYEIVEKSIEGVTDLGSVGRSAIPTDVWNKFKALDTKLIEEKKGGIGALFVDHSLGKTISDSIRADLKEAGIPEIRLSVADPYEDISASMLMGFLIGGDVEETARNYATKSWSVLHTIESKLSSLTDKDKRTYIGISMSYWICQNDSTFGQIGSYVSGIPYYTVNSEFAKTYEGTSSTKMTSTEALSNYAIKSKLGEKRGIEAIFSSRSIDFTTGNLPSTIVSEWEKSAGTDVKTMDFFKDLDCYQSLYYINNLLPGACKLAYAAACLYPNQYSMDEANEVVKEFANFCPTLKGATIENTLFCFGYNDYVAAKKA